MLSSWQGAHAASAAGPWFETDMAKMRLISSSETAGMTGDLNLGLEVVLAPGWKTYWRTPGDAGLAPQIKLDAILLDGATSTIAYPMPKRFTLFDLETFGYSDQVIFPMTLRLGAISQAATIEMLAEILVCSDVCITVQAPLKLALLMGDLVPSEHYQAIAQARSLVPKTKGDAIALMLAGAAHDPDRAGHLIAELSPNHQVNDILIEGLYPASFGAPQKLDETRYLLPQIGRKGQIEDGKPITVTIDSNQAFEAEVIIGASQSSESSLSWQLPIWLIALLGGFILNFMPCVLPVISLKLGSVISMGGGAARQVRLRFLASAAGILTSFGLLAIFLHSLRALGAQIGWGVQFQSPVFLAFLLLVTTLFTLSLAGVVSIPVPAFVLRLSPRSASHQYQGDFAAGMLATLLATPCSAPFVGTAVSFAFSQSTLSLYGIMLMMGLGLAVPWLIVAALPSVIAFLPKPGAWMASMQKGLAVLMGLTVLWVASLFAGATGLREKPAPTAGSWVAYDEALLAEWRAADRLVFVDVTADWCITCKANKALVLDTDQGQALFSDNDVALMQADWTNTDAEIARYLSTNNRFGIPFNVVYGKGAKQGVILPEIFSYSDLQKAILQANQSGR